MAAAGATQGAPQVAVAWWLRGATAQTLWARLARSRQLVRFEREVLTTDDDDDLVLDHAPGPAGSPRLLLLHGLEGSAHSLHTQGLAVQAARVGWRCTVLNFRSCARDPQQISRRLKHRRPPLSRGRARRPGLRGAHAGRARARRADLRRRVLAGRERS